MKAVGVLTTVVLAAALAAGVAVAIRSMPDVKRYLAIRRM
jgi:hypothetical protein